MRFAGKHRRAFSGWQTKTRKQSCLLICSDAMLREKTRHENSRIEVGDSAKLVAVREMSRALPVKLSIFIVQPGLSRSNATTEQLELISVTENYLMETYQLPFRFIASK